MPDSQNDLNNLKTLESPDGAVPPERIGTPEQAKGIYDALLRADFLRSKKRALLKGMLDGNPPYSQSELNSNGRGYQCNVNWRIAESYFNKAKGAFYDIFSEASTYALVRTKMGNPEEQEAWSECITAHFDWLLKSERTLDWNVQGSQQEMVFYGRGPLMFQDEFDWRPISVLDGALKVPERTKSHTEYWELCTIERDYLADELYSYIKDTASAKEVGWDVQATRTAIMQAHPMYLQGRQYQVWEWHQEELKNGSFAYGMRSRIIPCVHVFNREFPKKGERRGKITHKIVISNQANDKVNKFLFNKVGRYDDWNQVIHPMYYDLGSGGFHHSVVGMGIAMYSAIEFQNRLKCNLADKAFTPKMMFKPTTEQAFDEFALTQMGEYSIISPGVEMMQTPIAGVMQEGLEFDREITNFIAGNLSQYRSDQQQQSGNPVTATEANIDASEQARLGKTQLNRYYEQEDYLLAEIYRRASAKGVSASDPGGELAKEFQDRCVKAGVPIEALRDIECVKANRVIGQGSEFLRRQTLGGLVQTIMGALPEKGRDNLITDYLAANAGYHAAQRYYPTSPQNQKPDDQTATAMLQVASMKEGIPAVVTDTQNPVIFAQTFLQAAAQSLQSVQQGADPMAIQAFVELAGQAIAQHLQKLAADPSRKPVFKALEAQWKQLAKVADQLGQHNKQNVQQQQQQRQQIAKESISVNYKDAPPEIQRQIEAAAGFIPARNGSPNPQQVKTDVHVQGQQAKTAAAVQSKAAITKVDIATKDALAAAEIRRKQVIAEKTPAPKAKTA